MQCLGHMNSEKGWDWGWEGWDEALGVCMCQDVCCCFFSQGQIKMPLADLQFVTPLANINNHTITLCELNMLLSQGHTLRSQSPLPSQ